MHTINFVVGDWSHDGHGMTYEEQFWSTLSAVEIKEAIAKVEERLGFCIADTVCREYEDFWMPDEVIAKLEKEGIVPEFEVWDNMGEEQKDMNPEFWVDMYLQIIKKGNPKFAYERIESKMVDIGGYGLFVS